MSSFDHITPPPPKGFVPITEVEEKLREDRWEVSDEAWGWELGILDDEQLRRRYHDAAAELEARALELTDDGHFVPRKLSEEELTRGRALENYWKTVVEIKVRRAVRDVLQAIAAEEKF